MKALDAAQCHVLWPYQVLRGLENGSIDPEAVLSLNVTAWFDSAMAVRVLAMAQVKLHEALGETALVDRAD
jgi:hypothetical protein